MPIVPISQLPTQNSNSNVIPISQLPLDQGQDSSDGVVESMAGYEAPKKGTRGLSSIPVGAARGIYEGGLGILDTLGNAGELAGVVNPQTPIVGSDFRQQSRNALDQILPPVQGIMGNVAEGLGQLPGTVAQLEAGGEVPMAAKFGLLGAINAQKGGASAMVSEGAKQALLGKILEMSGGLKNPLKSGIVGGAAMGGTAALEGQPSDKVAAQAAIGTGLGILGNPNFKASSPQEVIGFMKGIPKTPQEIGQAWEQFKENLHYDPIQNAKDKIAEHEANVKEQGAQFKDANSVETQKTQTQYNDMQKAEQEATRNLMSATERAQADAKANANTRIGELNNKIDSAIDRHNSKVQPDAMNVSLFLHNNIPTLDKEVYTNWNNAFESAASVADKKLPLDTNIRVGILTKVAEDLVNSGYQDHPVTKGIFKLIHNISGETNPLQEKILKMGIGGVPISEMLANPSTKQLAIKTIQQMGYNPAEVMSNPVEPFASFYNRTKSIWSKQNPSDVAGRTLKVAVADILGEANPAFKETNQKMKEVLGYLKDAKSDYGVYKSTSDISSSGVARFSRLGQGKATPIDENMIRFLSKGEVPSGKVGETKPSGLTTGLSGLGELTKPLAETKQKLAFLADYQARMNSENGIAVTKMMQGFRDKLEQLASQGKLSQTRLADEKRLALTQLEAYKEDYFRTYDSKIAALKRGKVQTKNLEHERTKNEGVINAAATFLSGFGGAKIARLGHGFMGLKRGFRR